MTPLLSVIIPCYNNGNYLVKMIDCFRRQTSPNWEMIIVDDGSTDDTPIVVKECIKDVPNIQYMPRNREPKGSVVCRNIGFEQSKGKYVCHLDADDLVSDTFVERRVAFMEAYPDVDYASFPAMGFSDIDKLPSFNDKGNKWGVGQNGEDLLSRFFAVDYPFSVWNNIYRRDRIVDFPWDEKVKIYTDLSYIVPMILAGLKHQYSQSKELDYYYRQGGGNVNNMCASFVSKEKCESTLYFFRKTLESLKTLDNYSIRKKQFMGLIITHFERLVLGENNNDIDEYLNLCGEYYDFDFISKLRYVENKTKNKSNARKKIALYYYLWRTFGHPRHKTILLMTLKQLLFR